MSIRVKSIDVYGIKERLRREEDKEVLNLIRALQEALERQELLTRDAIAKLKKYAEKYGNIE